MATPKNSGAWRFWGPEKNERKRFLAPHIRGLGAKSTEPRSLGGPRYSLRNILCVWQATLNPKPLDPSCSSAVLHSLMLPASTLVSSVFASWRSSSPHGTQDWGPYSLKPSTLNPRTLHPETPPLRPFSSSHQGLLGEMQGHLPQEAPPPLILHGPEHRRFQRTGDLLNYRSNRPLNIQRF